jgi:hypothetical protein
MLTDPDGDQIVFDLFSPRPDATSGPSPGAN